VIDGINISSLNGKLYVNNKTGNAMSVSVYSTTGSLVKHMDTMNSIATTLNQGVYVVKATIGNKTMVQKVVL